jgi:dienelactone hydrolase
MKVSPGPYNVLNATFVYDALDKSDQHIEVLYPSGSPGQTFPLVVYAHGFDDAGGDRWYPQLGHELASWGYAVAFPNACAEGCWHDCTSHLGDPPCFGHYYRQQLLTIQWASSAAAAGLPLNLSAVAVAGHSMGGQATLFSAANQSAVEAHNIKAAALHHPFTHTYSAAKVPFLVFTGTDDFTAPPRMAERLFDAPGACPTRGLVNKRGANHHEASTDYNPMLGLYTVAWFKVIVEGLSRSHGMEWEAMVFGQGNASLCGGGDGEMESCSVLRPQDLVVEGL